jgi:hypothetical protein
MKVLYQLPFKPARRRMFTVWENMLSCEQWTRSFELETVLWSAFAFLLLAPGVFGDAPKSDNSDPDPITSIVVTIDKGFTPDHASDVTATLSSEEIGKLRREKVEAIQEKGPKRTYEGVPLAAILTKAGMKWEQGCRSPAKGYVVVGADDGYQAVFSIVEIHPQYHKQQVILADVVDGKKLAGQDAPWKIVEERDDFAGRWVRLVTHLSVKMLPDMPAETVHKPAKKN